MQIVNKLRLVDRGKSTDSFYLDDNLVSHNQVCEVLSHGLAPVEYGVADIVFYLSTYGFEFVKLGVVVVSLYETRPQRPAD